MSIKILDNLTINKIAAGEVIENPSNVVKELIENSIDAKATKISIEIVDAGKELIKVVDDGTGFEEDDIEIAFLNHATSKLNKIDDLQSINSFGFRGEALSSIASVSNVTLITKNRYKNNNNGNKIEVSYGNYSEIEECASNVGTTIIIKNLFGNVPVRKSFLKSNIKENSYIEDIVTMYALSKPEISFELVIDGRIKFKSPGDGDIKNIVYNLYGKEIYDNLIEVDNEYEQIAVKGFIAKPIVSRNNRNDEICFVNNRYIKSQIVQKAVEGAYEGYLMQHKYPLYILKIDIDSKIVDVNIHPKKLEVRFSDDEKVYYAIYNAVYTTLRNSELILEEKIDRDVVKDNKSFFASFNKEDSNNSIFNTNTVNDNDKTYDLDTLPSLGESNIGKLNSGFKIGNMYQILDSEFSNLNKKPIEKPFIESSLTENHKYIGQIFKTYILVEYEEKLYIIDQHAAHEKINYETIMRQYKKGDVLSQNIVPSIVLHLTPTQFSALVENIVEFKKIGYDIETFGDLDIKVSSVPYNIFNIGNKDLLMDMIDSFVDSRNKEVYDSIAEKIASISCKKAIKANHELSEIEVKELLRELFKLDNPYNCPHGRPTIISLSKYEFEKKFGRVL